MPSSGVRQRKDEGWRDEGMKDEGWRVNGSVFDCFVDGVVFSDYSGDSIQKRQQSNVTNKVIPGFTFCYDLSTINWEEVKIPWVCIPSPFILHPSPKILSFLANYDNRTEQQRASYLNGQWLILITRTIWNHCNWFPFDFLFGKTQQTCRTRKSQLQLFACL